MSAQRVAAGQSFGARLRDVRKSLGLTLLEVGQAAKVSEAAVSHYEADRRTPDRDVLWEVSKYLGDLANVPAHTMAGFLQGQVPELRLSPIILS